MEDAGVMETEGIPDQIAETADPAAGGRRPPSEYGDYDADMPGAGDVSESILDSYDEDEAPPLKLKDGSEKNPVTNKLRKLSSISSKLSTTRLSSVTDEVFEQQMSTQTEKKAHLPKSFGGVFGSELGSGTSPGTGPETGIAAGSRAMGVIPTAPVAGFPPIYNIIRANKTRAAAATILNGTESFPRKQLDTAPKAPSGLLNQGDQRCFRVQNYHSVEKGLNISLSVRRPTPGTEDLLECTGCPAAHSLAGRMRENGLPILVVLSDQNFSPVLPAVEGCCPAVIRVEDGTLQDITGVFLERFNLSSPLTVPFPPVALS